MPAAEPYGPFSPSSDGPYANGVDVTLHDTDELAIIPFALMATTTAGKVTVVSATGLTFNVYLPLGVAVKVRAKIVKATGATAAGVTALW
jgi:hypothetical protein